MAMLPLMSIKLLSCIVLLLVISVTGHAVKDIPNQKSSPFDFIKTLKGCHKGNQTKDIAHLKNYLHEFGYLNDLNQTELNNDDFDDALEMAIKTYQRNFHVQPTGIIDDETVSKMIVPRCGVPDIVNGTNYMQASRQHDESSSSMFHTVSHYSFFSGNPKWPSTKTNLLYGFLPNTPTIAIAPVSRAFGKWDAATFFTFSQARSNQTADLVIGFYQGNHGDGSSFDGPGGILAHAFAPTNGRFHYDGAERWSDGAVQGSIDLESVAIHEIGHLLGLGHSSVVQAIMYPSISSGVTKNLDADDINGIKALYNK